MAYVVKSALVIAKAEDGSLHHLYRGTPIPDNIPDAEVERLVADEMVGEGDAGQPPLVEDQEPGRGPVGPLGVDGLKLAEAREVADKLGIETAGLKVGEIREAIERAKQAKQA
jgi:hypothetical protein